MLNTLFPLGIATGHAFCNRKIERKHLLDNILSHTDTLISAPRRYGKTSLVEQVKRDLGRGNKDVVFIQVDFLLAGTPESAQSYLLSAVAEGITKILPLEQQVLERIIKIFKALRAKVSVGSNGLLLEIEPHPLPEKGMSEALMALDKIAGKQKKLVVIFMDEFQQIGGLPGNAIIEAAIRHAAQYAKHSNYIFSGSNRHLLHMMFDDNARPLYHICDRIILERISENEYKKFIQRAAQKKWGGRFEPNTLEIILESTKRHPYYVNVLCDSLWRLSSMPAIKQIKAAWDKYISAERHRVSMEIGGLSNYQRELLTLLALKPTAQPRSNAYLTGSTIKSGTVGQLIEKLLSQDLIIIDDDGVYRLIDPVIEKTIKHIAKP